MNESSSVSSASSLLHACVALLLCSACVEAEAPSRAPGAYEQNRELGRGVNILGWDPLWRDTSKARFTAEHFRLIHDAGFQNVRVVLYPFRDAGPQASEGKISDKWFQTLDWAIDHALPNHLMVDLDFHEYEVMSNDPVGNKDRFLSMWSKIAGHCRDRPRQVLFEILNEPHGKLTPDLWNEFLAEAVAVIRKSNPNRTLVIGPGQWNGIGQLEHLRLPEGDRNIIVTIHYYSPMSFTHQGAPWTGQKDKLGVPWNGTEPERAAIVRDFDKAQSWADAHHRPLFLGEFGAYDKADMDSRVRWAGFVAREAEKRGWNWAW